MLLLVFEKAVVGLLLGSIIQAVETLGLELLEVLWYGVVAAVLEVGPDDVFLREAEHTKSASTHGGVYGDPRVSHQLRAFIKAHPGAYAAGTSGRRPCPSSPHSWSPSTAA